MRTGDKDEDEGWNEAGLHGIRKRRPRWKI